MVFRLIFSFVQGNCDFWKFLYNAWEDFNGFFQKFLDELAQRLTDNLAAYAIPVFLRICSQVDRTGTFKLKKAALQRDGYDPEKCGGDALYYWNAVERGYRLLSTEMKNDIDSGAYTKIWAYGF